MSQRTPILIACMLLFVFQVVDVELGRADECSIRCPAGACQASGAGPCTCQCVGNLGDPSCSCGSSGGGKIVPQES